MGKRQLRQSLSVKPHTYVRLRRFVASGRAPHESMAKVVEDALEQFLDRCGAPQVTEASARSEVLDKVRLRERRRGCPAPVDGDLCDGGPR